MIYLDNAATSFPKPKEVITAVNNAMTNYSNPGRGSYKYSYDAAIVVEQARNTIADMLKCDSESIIFTLNCTDGLSCAIFGTLKKGDHVLTTIFEHNSVLRPLEFLKQHGIIDYDCVAPNESGNYDYKCFDGYIKKNTAMLITTHVSNTCGKVIDIKSIYDFCKSKRIIYCVDAAQSAGSIEIDATMADIICLPGHKGLLGPMGCGAMYLSPNIDPIPIRMGGTGSESESLMQPFFRPDRYESGTLPFPAIMGLDQGVKLVKDNIVKIQAHEQLLAQHLTAELLKIKKVKIYTEEACRSGIVLFNICKTDSRIVSTTLADKFKIATRGGFHCAPLAHKYLGTLEQGGVRVSFGINNNQSHVEELVYAIKSMIGSL